MKLKAVPARPLACLLCGGRFEDPWSLNFHLEKKHNTTLEQLKKISVSTTGPQGPGGRKV
jgi:hypothetical protein